MVTFGVEKGEGYPSLRSRGTDGSRRASRAPMPFYAVLKANYESKELSGRFVGETF